MQNLDINIASSEDLRVERFGIIQECAHCGLLNHLSEAVPGNEISCVRCDNGLRRPKKSSLQTGLAWAIAGAFFYVVALTTPLMNLGIYGNFRTGSIESGPLMLDNQGYWPVATAIFLTTIVAPFLKIAGMLAILVTLRRGKAAPWVGNAYSLIKYLNPWVMIEVYLFGLLVAYSRLQSLGNVHPSAAILGLAGLMVSMIAMDVSIDPEDIWEKIGKARPMNLTLHPKNFVGCDTCHQINHIESSHTCLRCGDFLKARKTNSLARAWALTIAAATLYIPSNMFPVMKVIKLGKPYSYTIFGGLKELGQHGLWPLAVLVFIASIAIPVFKILILIFMLIETHYSSSKRIVLRTRLYRLLDFIGRWSMVDIFVVSLLAALVRFDWLTQIVADTGSIYFTSVVILTLLAVKSFDPRLMWDAAITQDQLPSSISADRLQA